MPRLTELYCFSLYLSTLLSRACLSGIVNIFNSMDIIHMKVKLPWVVCVVGLLWGMGIKQCQKWQPAVGKLPPFITNFCYCCCTYPAHTQKTKQ